jgi:hypothetical protein
MLAPRIARIADLVRHAPLAALALQLVLLIASDPGTAASGGGDFPYRLR